MDVISEKSVKKPQHHQGRKVWDILQGEGEWRRLSWGGGRVRATSAPTRRSNRLLVDPSLLLVTQTSHRLWHFFLPACKNASYFHCSVFCPKSPLGSPYILWYLWPIALVKPVHVREPEDWWSFLCSSRIKYFTCDKSRGADSTKHKSGGENIPCK